MHSTASEDRKDVVGGGRETEEIKKALAESLAGARGRRFVRFIMAALGSIPWVGGFISASAAFSAEGEQSRTNELHRQWMDEHSPRLQSLGAALKEILERLDAFGEEAEGRVASDSYLALVRKGFGIWDRADTDHKRTLVKNLLANAAGTSLCSDDLVRLFLEWIERYHETHFMVIREVFRNPGIARGGIWDRLRVSRPREDSAEADLFRMLVDDLSQGRIIRQGGVPKSVEKLT